MAEMCGPISAELGVPVVDGVTAATLTVQSLVAMGLATSKRGEYASPAKKDYWAGG
jgi:allantoin racemase